ncbi:protein-export chaperone SecB [Clostridium nigeriense]|uniref:protein-export chaperone SecB n=1 Tax=Clostridium nigeriense TaxID=1805470 RepID=UPI00082D1FC2|nr:protein-export chaperone SecB [Clostridium nigeriense]
MSGQTYDCILELGNVYVQDITYKRSNSYSQIDSDLEFKIGAGVDEGESNSYRVNINIEICDTNSNDFNLEFSTVGIFKAKGEFLQKNAMAILFPYVRSFLTTLTAQIGVKPIILPPINFNALLDKDN